MVLLLLLLQYRCSHNVKDSLWLGARLGDKILMVRLLELSGGHCHSFGLLVPRMHTGRARLLLLLFAAEATAAACTVLVPAAADALCCCWLQGIIMMRLYLGMGECCVACKALPSCSPAWMLEAVRICLHKRSCTVQGMSVGLSTHLCSCIRAHVKVSLATTNHVSCVVLPLPPCVSPTGDYYHLANYPIIAALLSMYAGMPAFAAVAYVPSITLGEWPCGTCATHTWSLPDGPGASSKLQRWRQPRTCRSRRHLGAVRLQHSRETLDGCRRGVPFLLLHAALSTFPLPAERNLFYRERNDGLYSAFTSLASKMLEEVLINAIVA